MTEPIVSGLRQIAFVVADVPGALNFFRQLGLPLLFAPSPQLAFLALGEQRLMLTTPQGAGTVGQNSVLYLQCHDIERQYSRLLACGVTGVQPPHLVATLPDHELWLAFFHDPETNLLALLEEKPRPN